MAVSSELISVLGEPMEASRLGVTTFIIVAKGSQRLSFPFIWLNIRMQKLAY